MEIIMKIETLLKFGPHFDCLGDEFSGIFDFDAIEALPSNKNIGEALRLLSQYLVGNRLGTAKEIEAMRPVDREMTINTWLDLVHDADTLRGMARYFVALN